MRSSFGSYTLSVSDFAATVYVRCSTKGTTGVRLFKLPAKIEKLLELDPGTLSVTTREGKHCEFKRDFIANDLSDYAKTLAGFANADGGILVLA